MQKRVLVTGGCGFIGTHVVNKLLDSGCSVHVVDDMSGANYEFFVEAMGDKQIRTLPIGVVGVWQHQREEKETADVIVFEGDFVEPPIIKRLASKMYDAVIHLAAEPSVQYCIKYPVSTHQNNLQKSVELFHICAKTGTRVVFASSAAVYGELQCDSIFEDMATKPLSPYGLQKLQAEQVISLFTKLYDLSAITLRFFNVYGPGQSGDSPYSTAIASWIDRIKSNEPLRLDGDGEQTRDYIHVFDVANACLLALKTDEHGILNIASGNSKSNNEILSILSSYQEVNVEHAPARVGDVKHSLASIDKAEKVLMFKPTININDGIIELLRGTYGW
jgi:UDP-glucose 4-epimerase